MKIFNIQQLFHVDNKRIAKWVSPLLFLVCFISFSNNVIAQQVVLDPLTASPATIPCAGGQTIITATASGPASIEYSIDGVNFQTENEFTVNANSYTVTAREFGVPANVATQTITIAETPLTAVVASGKNWSCASPGCNGTLTVDITNGKPNYTINVTGAATLTGSTSGNSYTFPDQLCAGTYHISVTDACDPAVTVTASDYVVALDNAGPSCSDRPSLELVDAAAYLSSPVVVDTVINNIYVATGGLRDVQTFTVINSGNYNNLQLQLLATSSGTGWTDSDTIKVEASYDSGTSWGAPVVEVVNGGTPLNTWYPLSNNQQDIQLRLTRISGNPSNTYTVEHLYVRGTNPSKSIVTSGPSGCTDNFATTLTTTRSDGPVTWHCTVPEPELEFSFIRTWEVKDDCGNITTYPQRISVGTAPVITDPEDTIINYCHNQDVDIKVPVTTEFCGILRYDWTMTNENNEPVTSGSCDAAGIVDYDFPQPVTADDSIFHITWTAVDNAGIPSYPVEQNVTIKRKMVVLLDANTDDFCSGATVTFDVSVSGGSGLYSSPIITPTETLNDLDNGHVTFTTNALKYEPTALLDVVVNYTDLDNVASDIAGGCTTGDITFSSGGPGGEFTVRPNITTNAISRMP